MWWFILWGVLFSVAFYYYCIKPISYWKKRGVKQGSPVWMFGDNLNVILKRESFFESVIRFYEEHPNERYSGMYQMMLPTLVIRDPDLIKQITVKDFDHFLDHRSFVPDGADPLWSKNLFALKGQRWREMRPVLSPAFTSSKMRAMFILMCETAESFVSYFKNKGEDIVEIEMKDNLTRFGNDVIASVAFGIKVDSMRNRNNEFFEMGKEATDFSSFPKILKFFGYSLFPKLFTILKLSFFSRKVGDFFIELINDTIKIREEQGIVRPDMIHLLLEARKGNLKQEETTSVDTGFATVEEINIGKNHGFHKREISNIDIAAHSLIFFFAGFESVATAASFMSYEIAVQPDIQNRLREEVLATDEECDGKLTYEALMNMKYMDMVFSETMRKWTNGVAADRVCTKPYTIPPVRPGEKPLQVNIGDVLWIPIAGIHRDPEYYPDPEKFDPERFNDENKTKIKPYTYMPFGLGPRNCIGSRFAILECKTLLYYVLRDFEIVPIKKTCIPLKIAKTSLNFKAENGLWLGLKRIVK